MVSLETAIKHLNASPGDGSPDPVSVEIADKLAQATEIVLDYIARPSDDDWTAEIASWQASPATEAPGPIRAAILAQLGELYRFRGDDEAPPNREVGDLSPMVKAYLRRYRDPVVA